MDDFVLRDIAEQSGKDLSEVVSNQQTNAFSGDPISSDQSFEDIGFFSGLENVEPEMDSGTFEYPEIPDIILQESTDYMRNLKEIELRKRRALISKKSDDTMYRSMLQNWNDNGEFSERRMQSDLVNSMLSGAVTTLKTSTPDERKHTAMSIVCEVGKGDPSLSDETHKTCEELSLAYVHNDSGFDLAADTLISSVPRLNRLRSVVEEQLASVEYMNVSSERARKFSAVQSEKELEAGNSITKDLEVLSDIKLTTAFIGKMIYRPDGLYFVCGTCGSLLKATRPVFEINSMPQEYVSKWGKDGDNDICDALSVTFSPNICSNCGARNILSKYAGESLRNYVKNQMRDSGVFITDGLRAYNLDVAELSASRLTEIFDSEISESKNSDLGEYDGNPRDMFPEVITESAETSDDSVSTAASNADLVPCRADYLEYVHSVTTKLRNVSVDLPEVQGCRAVINAYLRWLITAHGSQISPSIQNVLYSVIDTVITQSPEVFEAAKNYGQYQLIKFYNALIPHVKDNLGTVIYNDITLDSDYLDKLEKLLQETKDHLVGCESEESLRDYISDTVNYTVSVLHEPTNLDQVNKFLSNYPVKNLNLDAIYKYNLYYNAALYCDEFFGKQKVSQLMNKFSKMQKDGEQVDSNAVIATLSGSTLKVEGSMHGLGCISPGFAKAVRVLLESKGISQSLFSCVQMSVLGILDSIYSKRAIMKAIRVPEELLDFEQGTIDTKNYDLSLLQHVPPVLPELEPLHFNLGIYESFSELDSSVAILMSSSSEDEGLNLLRLDASTIASIVVGTYLVVVPENLYSNVPELLNSAKRFMENTVNPE